MIPAADTREVSEHFVIEENGHIIDPTMVNLTAQHVGGSLKSSIYYACMEQSAEWLGIHPYDSKPLHLTPQQFDIFMDVVTLTAEIMRAKDTHISLSLLRESIIVLLDVWDEDQANKKLAAVRVMARQHGVSIKLKPVTTPACMDSKARATAEAEEMEALKVAQAKAAAAAEELLAQEEKEKQQVVKSTKAGKAKQSKGKKGSKGKR